jgi:hypothetical protein
MTGAIGSDQSILRSRMPMTLKAALAVLLLALPATQAKAESCTPSREYILTDDSGDLPRQPASYQALFKVCLATLMLPNVRDAFILRDGGIAVVPRLDDLAATANTLADFCTRYPQGTLRFITHGELAMTANIGRAVQISSGGATSCRKITGHAP